MKPTKFLNCIKVENTFKGEKQIDFLDLPTFEECFVKDRWQGERRYNKRATIFGVYHTKATVPSPDGSRAIVTITFPKSVEHAREIDAIV